MEERKIFSVIVALSVSSLVLSQDDEVSSKCPTNLPFTSAMKLFDDKCYQFVSQEKYWHQARDHCLRNNGRLVKIDDPQTNEFIVNSLNDLWWQNNGVWIGLHDIGAEMHWQWTGFELHRNEPVLWTNWGRGHPGAFLHSHRDCVRMVRGDGWKWHETVCSALKWHYRFICEYNASSPPRNTRGMDSISLVRKSVASDSSQLGGFDEDDQPLYPDVVPAAAAAAVGSRDEDPKNDELANRKRTGILAVAVSCLLVATVAAVIIFMFRRRRRLHRERKESLEKYTNFKNKELEDGMTDTSSFRPAAVANIYVDVDGKGRVTTRLSSNRKPEISEDDETDSYDDVDDDDDNERQRETTNGFSAKEAREKMEGTKIPKTGNIYAEIEEKYSEYPENCHIYEALEDVRK